MKGTIAAIIIIALLFFVWAYLGGSKEVDKTITPEDRIEEEAKEEMYGEEAEVLTNEKEAVVGEEVIEELVVKEKVFNLTGKDYEFSIKEIRVKEGDKVTINFTAESGYHNWVVDEFEAETEKVQSKDGVATVTFIASKAGTYEYYCSVEIHRELGMVGKLIVE